VRFSPSAKRQEKRETRVLVSAALMLHDDIFLGGGGVDPRTPFRVRCALARLPATSEPSWWEAHAGAVTDSTHDQMPNIGIMQTARAFRNYGFFSLTTCVAVDFDGGDNQLTAPLSRAVPLSR